MAQQLLLGGGALACGPRVVEPESLPPFGPAPPTEGPHVTFLAVGDTGSGSPAQRLVAAAMARRAEASGADFVLLGRAFLYGVAALGERGGDHTVAILVDELSNVMTQLGCRDLAELARVDWRR